MITIKPVFYSFKISTFLTVLNPLKIFFIDVTYYFKIFKFRYNVVLKSAQIESVFLKEFPRSKHTRVPAPVSGKRPLSTPPEAFLMPPSSLYPSKVTTILTSIAIN